MGILANPQHEKFAQLVASGESGTKAYAASGYSAKGASQCAVRLRKDAKVAARIAELTAKKARNTMGLQRLSKEWISNGLADIAAEGKNESARVRAMEIIAKMEGFLVEKTDTTMRMERTVPDLVKLSDDKLAAFQAMLADTEEKPEPQPVN